MFLGGKRLRRETRLLQAMSYLRLLRDGRNGQSIYLCCNHTDLSLNKRACCPPLDERVCDGLQYQYVTYFTIILAIKIIASR